MNRLFPHSSSDENLLDQWNNEQSTHQLPDKGDTREISKLPEVWLNTKRKVKTSMKSPYRI